MIKIFSFVIVSLFVLNPLISQYDGDRIFDNSVLHEIKLFSENKELISDLYKLWEKETFSDSIHRKYLKVDVVIDGDSLNGIGIRIKGNITALDIKKPFKLDFDRFNEELEYDGINKLNLHQGWMEKSFVREMLSLNVLRTAGVKSSRSSPAKVYLNGEYLGLYTLVEQVNRGFLKANFTSKYGLLMKHGILDEIKSGEGQVDSIKSIINHILSIPINILNDSIEQYMDVESFLKYFAVEILVAAVDDIISVDKDYYIYLEPKSNRLVYIPWDLNTTFYGVKYKLLYESKNDLFKYLIQNKEIREDYKNHMCNILLDNYTEKRLYKLIDDYKDLIIEAVKKDPYVNSMIDIPVVKQVIHERISSISNELIENSIECEIDSSMKGLLVINEIMASNDSTSSIMDPDGGHPDWIELYNNSDESIPLKNYYLSHDKDFFKFWSFDKKDTIKPHDYFIIWADKDLDQSGVHSNFKLKKKKGALILSNSSDVIIDSLSFRDQETNISLARFPNGTGAFKKQDPTFGRNNNSLANKELKSDNKIRLYPNPTTGNTFLDFGNSNINKAKITVYNIEGKEILNFIKQENESLLKMDMGNMISGLFYIKIQTDNYSIVKKLLVGGF